MSTNYQILKRLEAIETGLVVLDDHLHALMKGQKTMTAALDKLTAAVDSNAVATDQLSDEVQVAIDYIKAHPAAGNDPELLALAARLEEKNAKAVAAKDALDAAVNAVSASGGPATA